jgi:hypothetical protein
MGNGLKKYFVIILLIFLFLSQKHFAQSDIVKGSFFYPAVMEQNEFKHEFSFLLAKLPEDAIEEASAWIYAPLFTYSVKYGLPQGFSLNGYASTNIITFQFRGGPQWGYSFNKVTAAIGFDVAYYYGQLNAFGFNSKVHGWQSYPHLDLGIEFKNFTLTFRGELYYILSMTQKADDLETGVTTTAVAASSFAILIEQPLWKNNFLTIGVNFHFTKAYWPAWAVFPSWERYFFIPEVIIGFVL